MTKLILRTIAVTLASVLVALAVAFGAATLFAPKMIAGIFDGVGNYSATVFFYEKQYQKTGSLDDLAVVINKLDKVSDKEKTYDYIKVMVSSDGFDDYCTASDTLENGLITTKEYFYSLYTESATLNEGFNKGVEIACAYVDANGYTEFNPIRMLISDFADIATYDQLDGLKNQIESRLSSFSATQTALANYDINDINQLLSDK